MLRPVSSRLQPKRKEPAWQALLVDLIGSLSHTALTDVLEQLDARDWRVAERPRKERRTTGRRKFATVSDAVVQVLSETGSVLRFIEIYEAVERLLDGPVARSSVKNALAREGSRRHPRFERVGYGRYRLMG
jgi:hypothetical protein